MKGNFFNLILASKVPTNKYKFHIAAEITYIQIRSLKSSYAAL